MPLRVFLDECLSPSLVDELYRRGAEVVIHPRDHGGMGQRDDEVLARCVRDDLILVTENARDFRRLVAREDIHPGLVVLPCVDRRSCLELLLQVLDHLGPDAMDRMVNKVLEVSEAGQIRMFDLPASGG